MNRRIGGLAGLAFIILTVLTLFLAPAPPAPSAPAAEVAAWIRDNGTGIEFQAVVFGLAALALVVFASEVHDQLNPGGSHDGVASAAWTGVVLLVGGWVLSYSFGALVALYADRLTDDSIMLGMVAYGAAASVGAVGMALFLAGFALSAYRQSAFPTWTSAVGAIGAVLSIGGLATYTTDSSAVFALLYAAFGALVIWIIGVSVLMLRSGVAKSTVRAMSPAA